MKIKNVMDDVSTEPVDFAWGAVPRVIVPEPEHAEPKPVYVKEQVVAEDKTPFAANVAPVTPEADFGRKDDTGKLDVTLFFNDLPHAIYAVTEVLQWAITKKQPRPYLRGSWQGVPDLQLRYQAAGLRHELNRAIAVIEGKTDEPTDKETDLSELAHIATSALFRLEMACRKSKGINVPEGA